MVQERSVSAKIRPCVSIVKVIALIALITNVFHLERVKLNQKTLLRDVKKQSSVIINNLEIERNY